MNRSLSKCQFVAFGAGVLLFATLIGVMVLFSLLSKYFQPDAIAVLLLILLLFLSFAFAIAVYAGRHDKVAFITCAVPAMAMGLIDGIKILQFKREMAAHHSMGSLIIGPGFFTLLFGAFILGMTGIALKRFVERLHLQ
ncbi:MAG: hypothetical protein ABI615_06170 [Chthoniobacterales bacterium]